MTLADLAEVTDMGFEKCVSTLWLLKLPRKYYALLKPNEDKPGTGAIWIGVGDWKDLENEMNVGMRYDSLQDVQKLLDALAPMMNYE